MQHPNTLDLPLEGRGWIIWLPLENWANLIQAVTEAVEVRADERLDASLQQALAVATALPPSGTTE